MSKKIVLALATPPVLFNQALNPFYLLFFSLSKFRSFDKISKVFWVISIFTIFSFSTQFILNLSNPVFSQQGHFFSLIAFFVPLLVLIFKIELSVEDILNSIFYGCLIYATAFSVTLFFIQQPPLSCVGCVKTIDFIGFPQRFTPLIILGSAIAVMNFVRSQSLFYLLAFALLLVPIFFSYTRSIWIQFSMTLIFLGLYAFYYLPLRKKLFFFMLILLLATIFSFILFLYTESLYVVLIKELFFSIIDAMNTFFSNTSDTIYIHSGSEAGRIYFWGLGMNIFMYYPILGTGLAGLYQFGYPEYGSIHSQWIDQLMRTGLFGLLIYIYFYIEICIQYLKKYPEVTSWIIGLGIFGFFNESTKIISIAMIFFVLLNKAIYREV